MYIFRRQEKMKKFQHCNLILIALEERNPNFVLVALRLACRKI